MSGTFTVRPPVSGLTDTVTGLSPSTSYDFEVTASNAAGTSGPSALITVVTPAVTVVQPSAPLAVTDSSVSDTVVNLTWTAPATGTTPFSYLVQYSLAGQNNWINGPTVAILAAQVTGLTASTSYDFRVFASNSAGSSAASTIFTVSTVATATGVTWNPTGASPTVVLSNANLTATANGGTATAYSLDQNCFSTTSKSAGNASFEVTLTQLTQNTTIGLSNALYVAGQGGNLGGDANATGYYPSTGVGSQAPQSIFVANAASLTPPGTSTADVAGATFTFCVNFDLGLWWVTSPAMRATYGATAWNDSATANPATGVGGIPIGVSGPLFIAFGTAEQGAIAVLNGGSSAFSVTVPSIFPPWGGGVITIVAPGSVTSLVAGTPGVTTMPLSWVAPTTGTGPFSYHMQYTLHGGSTWTDFGTTSALNGTITGLVASTSYDFRVFATNAAGQGGNSNVVTASTIALPSVPGQVQGVAAGSPTGSSILVSWQAPATGGAPTGYQVQFKLSGASTFTNAPSTTAGLNQTITGLSAASTYNFQVFAFNAAGNGVVSSPAVTATTSAAGGTGPAASSGFLAVDFSVTTGHTLTPWMFGSSMASDGPQFGAGGGQNWSNAQVQNTAKNTAGFGLPGMFARSNSNETTMNSDGSPVNADVDNVSLYLPSIITMPTSAADMAHGQFSYSLGIQSGDGLGDGAVSAATYAASALAIHKRFIANGKQIWYYEVGNEPNGRANVTDYCARVNAVAVALHGFDPTIRIIAGITAAAPGFDSFLATVAQQCGANLDIMCYHNYSATPTDFFNIANTVRGVMIGTACATKPTMQGEFNQDGSGGDGANPNGPTNNGMLTNLSAIYETWTADPLTIIATIWDWLGDGNYGLIGDPGNGNPPGVPPAGLIQTGYALRNCRAHMAGSQVTVTTLPNGLLCLATKSGTNLGVWLINNGQGNKSGQVALSHWPVNATGNGTVNVYTVSDSFPQSNTASVAVTAGLTASVSVPNNSVVVISNT